MPYHEHFKLHTFNCLKLIRVARHIRLRGQSDKKAVFHQPSHVVEPLPKRHDLDLFSINLPAVDLSRDGLARTPETILHQ
jgi:hypothetical protein